MKGWQKRYFVLRQNRIEYFQTEKDFDLGIHPKGIIQFDSVRVILTEQKNLEFSLSLQGSSRVFRLKCKRKEEYDCWITELNSVIKESKGYRLNIHISDGDFNIDFWRFAHIKEEEFLSDAETGDIVLFRGSHFGAKLTRKWTNGSVDHAAMVIRLEKYDN